LNFRIRTERERLRVVVGDEAVAREIKEEVGIEVTAIRYFGSQSWPFPHSLMIGFTADYAGGEIAVDETEIVDARWFTAENLPDLPGKLSIARALVDAFLDAHREYPTPALSFNAD